ncbi:hypothetical protein MTR_3g077520 [Medicago truncatula]|uniref:Uncharacterized protein n=1 Tax=Medicago truncatula TaxID=3880 RepID=G7J5D4_MEDTR|nr:hypothetical protein MTR_3g077520 [Medicago truncatula]
MRISVGVACNFFFGTKVRGWCPSPRPGRPSGSKSTYKDNYIYLPSKALTGLELRFSRIQDLSFYH